MNRIYKVIRRRVSDEVVVVSELTKERGKGQGALSRTRRKKKLSSLMRQVMRTSPVMGILLFSGMGNSALAEEWVGDSVYGTRSYQEEFWPDVERSGNQNNSVGTGSIWPFNPAEVIQGTVSIGAGETILGSVTGGSAMTWKKAGDAKTGDVDGWTGNSYADVYSDVEALSSKVTADENSATVGENASVGGNLYGGSATVLVHGGEATTGDVTSIDGSASSCVFSDVVADQHSVGDQPIVTANANTVTVGEGAVLGGSLYGGFASIEVQSGDATTGKASSENVSNVLGVSNFGHSGIYIYVVNDRSIVTANANSVTVADRVSIDGNLYGGFAGGEAQAGDGIAGIASTDDGVNGVSSSAIAEVYTTVRVGGLRSANSNTVIVGEGVSVGESLYGGSASMIAQGGNSTAGDAAMISFGGGDTFASTSAYSNVNAEGMTLIANENAVTVRKGVSVGGALYGGFASMIAQGGEAVAGNVEVSNVPSTASVNVAMSSDASALANGSTMTANENVLVVGEGEGTSITGNLYGGSATAVVKAGNATGGTASIAFLPLSPITDCDSSAVVNISYSMVTANDNKVIVGEHSELRSDVYGGYAGLTGAAGTAIAGTVNGSQKTATAYVSASGTQVLANNNEVSMNGILTGGSIYGGSVLFDMTQGTIAGDGSSTNVVHLNDSVAQAINNTVTLGANAQTNSPSGSLYGGYLEYNPGFAPESYDVFSGNTLNFSAKTPAFVQNVGNFEYYNFTLNPIYVNTSTALISAEDISLGVNTDNMDSSSQNGQTSKIKVVGIHSGNVLNAGDSFILMKASDTMTSEGVGESSTGVRQGISLLYDVETAVDSANKKVTATILGTSVNPQLKSLAEGYLLGSQLVTRGADLIADDAYRAIQEQNPQGGWSPFMVLSGQHTRYNSGSHIKSNDFLMAGGLSYQQKNWLAGAFLEGGWGSYDSYNSFSQVSDVHGTGNDRYYGLGLLGRYQLTSGFYSDASVRFGRNRTKFDTNDIQNFATGEFAHYNLTSNYVSGHIGVGYLVPLTEKNELDISAKYLYTTLSGKNATIAGDRIDFDRVDSNRIRLGIQLNHQYSKTVTLHSGLAYEYEFDGKAGANTYGISIGDAPSLKGGTGILSIGALVKARPNLNFDLKLNGYTGKREGFGANLKMTYLF